MSRPCFLKCRSASFASAPSAIGRNCSSASSTTVFRPEPAPHAAQLESDDARTDDAKPLRHRIEFERAPGIHDLLAVECDAAQRHRLRPGREHDVLGLQRPLRAVVRREFDLAAWQQLAVTRERRDARGLEQRRGCPASSA